MAFGNKKNPVGPTATVAQIDGQADDDALDDAESPLFGADTSADGEVRTAEPEAEDAVPEPEPAPAADTGTDALLSMFQSSEGGVSDRSAVLDLAGDVELADLIEELQTLSSALGIVRA